MTGKENSDFADIAILPKVICLLHLFRHLIGVNQPIGSREFNATHEILHEPSKSVRFRSV